MRKEDVGRMMFKNMDKLEEDRIKEEVTKFFNANPLSNFFLLNGRRINYFTFIEKRTQNLGDLVNSFMVLIDECCYVDEDGMEFKLSDVKEIEFNEDLGYLEMWCGGDFFALMPWGMEVI